MTGLMDKPIVKVNQKDIDRYEKLFNTDNVVSKNNRPFPDYTFLSEI